MLRVSPSVTVEPSGGHSFGHAVVRVDSGEHLAVYLGHLVFLAIQFVDPGPHERENMDHHAAEVRCGLLDELADRGGTALTTLVGGPGGGVVHRDGDGYRLEFAGA